jgi:hypothetical protein
MKVVLALLAILSVNVCASAQAIRKPTKEGYMRCMAVTQIMSRDFAKGEAKNKFKSEFEAWVKLVGWFYPDPKALIAEAGKVIKSIQAELVAERLSPKGFVEISDQCSVLLLRTMMEFTQCTKENGHADKARELCAKRSVGL